MIPLECLEGTKRVLRYIILYNIILYHLILYYETLGASRKHQSVPLP